MLVITEVTDKRSVGQYFIAIGGFRQIVAQAVSVGPLGFSAIWLNQRNGKPWAEYCLGTQQVLEP